jgi:hypothetical protein
MAILKLNGIKVSLSMPLQGTPTMAAGITKEVWSIRRLLFMRTPDIWDAELDHVFL